MKQALVLPLLLLAIILAAILHSGRVNTYPIEDSFEKLSVALKGINTALPANTNISIQTVGVSTEIMLFSGCLLAPRCSRGVTSIKMDTVLNICSINTTDSVLSTIKRRGVIWSNKDDQYLYYLTANNR